MTPDQRRDFESEWPALARRLESFLARKGVPAVRREDLVQETAARLFGHWAAVDRSVPIGALACTIALNLLRDEARRTSISHLAELPDAPSSYDLEDEGMARLELARVVEALRFLGPAHRAILLQEIGAAGCEVGAVTPDAAKMMRHRARRKLSEILQKMAGVFSYRLLRIFETSPALFAAPDRAFGAMACVSCLFMGLGGSVALTLPRAEEESRLRSSILDVESFGGLRLVGDQGVTLVTLVAAVEPGTGAAAAEDTTDGRDDRSKQGSGGTSSTQETGGGHSETPNPSGLDTSGVSSDAEVTGAPDGSETPVLPPATGEPEAPSVPTAPSAPEDEAPTDVGHGIEAAAELVSVGQSDL